LMTYQTRRDEYDAWVPAREALEQGITLPG
jgi:hypothetical protein